MPVAHPVWTEALDAIQRQIAKGPGTILLVGPPGTGKTVMLRHLAACLGSQDQVVTVVGQGDLPCEPIGDGVVLVDEAWRMPPGHLLRLFLQRRRVVVLADTDRLAAIATASAVPVIRLRPLTEAETGAFAVEWLKLANEPSATLTEEALARIAVHADGAVRLIVQLLGAAVEFGAGSTGMTVVGDDIDHAAAMRQNWMVEPEPAVATGPVPSPVPVAASPHRLVAAGRARRRVAVAAVAVAACVGLLWMLRPNEVGNAEMRSIQPARTPYPVLVREGVPALGATPTARMAIAVPAPVVGPMPNAELASVPPPPVAGDEPDAVLPVAQPTLSDKTAVVLANPVAPRSAPIDGLPALRPAPARLARRSGGPGMIVVAQRGDTLESLYGKLYRGRAAPPYADVEAANALPVEPGSIVVFPEPPGGWSAAQR